MPFYDNIGKKLINVNNTFKVIRCIISCLWRRCVITKRNKNRNIPNSSFELLNKMYMIVFTLQFVISIAYSYGKIYQIFTIFFYQDVPVIHEHFLSVYNLLHFLPTFLSFKYMFVSLFAFGYAFRIQRNYFILKTNMLFKEHDLLGQGFTNLVLMKDSHVEHGI